MERGVSSSPIHQCTMNQTSRFLTIRPHLRSRIASISSDVIIRGPSQDTGSEEGSGTSSPPRLRSRGIWAVLEGFSAVGCKGRMVSISMVPGQLAQIVKYHSRERMRATRSMSTRYRAWAFR